METTLANTHVPFIDTCLLSVVIIHHVYLGRDRGEGLSVLEPVVVVEGVVALQVCLVKAGFSCCMTTVSESAARGHGDTVTERASNLQHTCTSDRWGR